jgi:Ni2+-binding GTPase involved in maturation of urease and hydrogenase
MASLLALADVAVVTKTDLVSQAEKEVFRESIKKVVPDIGIVEINGIQGTGVRYLMRRELPPSRIWDQNLPSSEALRRLAYGQYV